MIINCGNPVCYPTFSYTCDTYTRTPKYRNYKRVSISPSAPHVTVCGHDTALLTEVGIPPLHVTQTLQLAQFRYRLSTNKNNIIPHKLYVREQHARAIMHDNTMGRKMHKAICQVDRDRIDPHPYAPISAASQTAELQKII